MAKEKKTPAAPKADAPKPTKAKKPARVVAVSDGIASETVREPAGRGRPSAYTTELGDRICERLADGETLIAICRDADMPSERTVRTWALDTEHEFSPKYDKSRILGYHRMADQTVDLCDKCEHEPGAVAKARLQVDTRKWLLSKALPKIYGDRISAEVTGKDGKDLVPDDVGTRDLARAIIDILRGAKAEEAAA